MESPKYNRTFHFPWSEGATNDDKIVTSVEKLIGVPIVITEKMDGSNVSLEADGCYARTHANAPKHESFDMLKAVHASVKYDIPKEYQLFGEWCYAQHSIAYSELPGYFLLFNVRELNTKTSNTLPNMWLSWDGVEAWSELVGLPTVPVLFKGIVSSEKELKELIESLMIQSSVCGGIREGVVARMADEFFDKDFSSYVMKCVRANHVQTSDHWKDQEIIRNKLKLANAGP